MIGSLHSMYKPWVPSPTLSNNNNDNNDDDDDDDGDDNVQESSPASRVYFRISMSCLVYTSTITQHTTLQFLIYIRPWCLSLSSCRHSA